MRDDQIKAAVGTWYPLLRSFMATSQMDDILTKTIIKPLGKVYPETEAIFKAFKLCAYTDFKILWLGQDPYHNGQASGLCMGMRKGDTKIPVTLRIVRQELLNDFPNKELDLTLEPWAKQGMLLYNTALTVEAKKPGEHLALWAPFTTFLLNALRENNTGVIYILLGKKAQEYKQYIDTSANFVIENSHPAAEAYTGGNGGFLNSRFFKRIQDIYVKQHGHEFNF